jgi:hypothetical protein
MGRARTTYLLTPLLLMMPMRAQEASPGLYAQAASAMLDRSFPSARIEYLLLDLRTGQVVAQRWPHAEIPIPAGSLLKPFVALAYSQLHSGPSSPGSPSRSFPIVHCHGKSDGCWHAGGHGSLGLERALAESCNAYFLALARELSVSSAGMDAVDHVSASYGLPAPPEQRTPRMLIGVTPEWRISPVALAHAYATLAAQPQGETAGRLLAGMRQAAGASGTAAKIGQHPGGVLAKTGTAPCVSGLAAESERCAANGDGLVVVLAPAEHPQLLLLVRLRGTTGAHAAELADRMLGELEDSHAPVR